jgi:hypothetical protein
MQNIGVKMRTYNNIFETGLSFSKMVEASFALRAAIEDLKFSIDTVWGDVDQDVRDKIELLERNHFKNLAAINKLIEKFDLDSVQNLIQSDDIPF